MSKKENINSTYEVVRKMRNDTWVGYRPSVIPAKKKNKKNERKQSKQIGRDAMKGEKE